jgi:hypothetical protein
VAIQHRIFTGVQVKIQSLSARAGAHRAKCRMAMMSGKLQQNSALFSDRLWREVPANYGLASFPFISMRWQESDIAHHSQPRADPPQMRARQPSNAIEVALAIDQVGHSDGRHSERTADWSRPCRAEEAE